MADAYDLIVLGAGTGGYSAAIRAASLGMRTAIIERDSVVGGTCLNRGCIPTKALLHSAELYDEIRSAGRFGVSVSDASYDWSKVQAQKLRIVDRMTKGLEGLLKKRQVEILRGTGVLRRPGCIEIDGRELEAPNVIIATGSEPKMLPGLAIGPRVMTSDQALALDHVPASAVIIGGGSVGVEFASVWASFGSTVTIVEMLPSLIPLEDADLGKELQRAFSKRGITSIVGAKLEDVQVGDDAVTCHIAADGKTRTVGAEVLLVAGGRSPVTGSAGLAEAGLALDRGFVQVDKGFATTLPGVYAVGDVIPTMQLAHVAFAEGINTAERIAGKNPSLINYGAIPRCTYCSPEIAAVGLTEPQARERGHDVVVKTVNFAGIGKAQILGESAGLCKIVAAREGSILGVHFIGPRVTELVAEAMLAVGWEAAPEEVAQLIHPHPTLSEVFGETSLALAGKALHT